MRFIELIGVMPCPDRKEDRQEVTPQGELHPQSRHSASVPEDEAGVEERMDQIRLNAAELRAQIEEAALRAGRRPAEIRLLPVTKFHPESDLRLLHDLGFTTFGENRVQELRRKSGELTDLDVDWILIGHLQSNKAGHAARIVSEVQSVDSLRIAQALNTARQRIADSAASASSSCPMPGELATASSLPPTATVTNSRPEEGLNPLRVLLQINTSGEAAKHGLTPASAPEVLEQVLGLPHLEIAGLMTMAPLSEDESLVRATFAGLRDLRDELQGRFPEANLRNLSMGMSHDFPIAIEEGATTVRVGTALLGPRT